MKTRISLNGLWLAVVALATVCASAPLWASSAFHGRILMEYIGQVINGTPTPASSNQFGNLHGVAGVDPSLQFTFYTEATTVKAVANGPLRIVDRTGTTTIYLASTPGDFRNWDLSPSGTLVQFSNMRRL